MNSQVENSVLRVQRSFQELEFNFKQIESNLFTTQKQMDAILLEQDLLERSTVALNQCKPLLSASSIKQCEELANSAISSVFNFPYTVEWDPESQRFLLNKGDYTTDLADAEGGGITAVISTIFTLYLLVKLGRRRFMAFDEAFTNVSAEYFPAFMEFLKNMCHDLGVDLLLVSHDSRISDDMVDHVYQIIDGHAKQLK